MLLGKKRKEATFDWSWVTSDLVSGVKKSPKKVSRIKLSKQILRSFLSEPTTEQNMLAQHHAILLNTDWRDRNSTERGFVRQAKKRIWVNQR